MHRRRRVGKVSPSVLFIRLTLSCHFWIFQNPRIQKGQKALEGSQKLKVSENRKSAILVGEIMVFQRTDGQTHT